MYTYTSHLRSPGAVTALIADHAMVSEGEPQCSIRSEGRDTAKLGADVGNAVIAATYPEPPL